MAKFSKGPWIARDNCIGTESKPNSIGLAYRCNHGLETNGTQKQDEEMLANATLISLAPDMYEAIKSLNLALDNYWNSQTKGDDLVKKITKEQAKCWEILKKVG